MRVNVVDLAVGSYLVGSRILVEPHLLASRIVLAHVDVIASVHLTDFSNVAIDVKAVAGKVDRSTTPLSALHCIAVSPVIDICEAVAILIDATCKPQRTKFGGVNA